MTKQKTRAPRNRTLTILDSEKDKKMPKIKHPAKYSDVLLPIFDRYLPDDNHKILDPFAGTGKLKQIRPNCTLLEIEPEWANLSSAVIGDATAMPFDDACFDAVCTSPTYGNRMADSFQDHQVDKKYKRNTYRHTLGRKLSDNNSGGMQWGEKYKTLHLMAWSECFRVLKNGGIFILNISDHIRKGKIIEVTKWHIDTLAEVGFVEKEHIKCETKRQRFGKNGSLRVGYESIVVFNK